MKIVVGETKVDIVEADDIVAGSVNIHSIKFEWDSIWDNYTKKVIFKTKNGSRTIPLDDTNTCIIPYEAMLYPGELQIGILGESDDKIRPTRWSADITIANGAIEADDLEFIFPTAEEASF